MCQWVAFPQTVWFLPPWYYILPSHCVKPGQPQSLPTVPQWHHSHSRGAAGTSWQAQFPCPSPGSQVWMSIVPTLSAHPMEGISQICTRSSLGTAQPVLLWLAVQCWSSSQCPIFWDLNSEASLASQAFQKSLEHRSFYYCFPTFQGNSSKNVR